MIVSVKRVDFRLSLIIAVLFVIHPALPSFAEKGGSPFQQQVEYSGDMNINAGGMTMTSKVFHAADKERTETMGAIMISRRDKKVVWQLTPAAKTYMETVLGPERQPPTERPDVSFKEAGTETIDGVKTTKYRFEAREKEHAAEGFVWISKEGVPLRTEMTGREKGREMKMVSELKNLKIGKQDPSLFEIPSGYRKTGELAHGGMQGGQFTEMTTEQGALKMFTDSKMEKFTETADYSAKIGNGILVRSSAKGVRLSREGGDGYSVHAIIARDKNVMYEFVPNMCAYVERKPGEDKRWEGYVDLSGYDLRFKKTMQITEKGTPQIHGDVEVGSGGDAFKGAMTVSTDGIVMQIATFGGGKGPGINRSYAEAKGGKQEANLMALPSTYKKLSANEFDEMLKSLEGRGYTSAPETYCNGGKGPAARAKETEKKNPAEDTEDTADTVKKGLDKLKGLGGIFGR